jgi:hypothetical protein
MADNEAAASEEGGPLAYALAGTRGAERAASEPAVPGGGDQAPALLSKAEAALARLRSIPEKTATWSG